MEDSLILKVNDCRYNICRACLRDEGEFQSVFLSDENSGLTMQLAEMIMAYASVQITLGDGLPEQICTSCAKNVVQFYLFKQQCEESDITLREQLNKPIEKLYTISEEQRLTAQALNIDPYLIDVVIKPEVTMEHEEQIVNKVNLEDNFNVSFTSSDLSDVEESADSNEQLKKFSCELCLKVFNRISHLNRHRNVHNCSKEYLCNICNEGFTRNDLLRHQAIHGVKAEELDVTMLCDEVVPENVVEQKYEEIDLTCIACDKQFLLKTDFVEHMAIHEPKLKHHPLRCHVCNKKFTKPSHLTRHLKIHDAVKPYLCKLCNKGFARSEQLVNHMNAHSGVKPHVCKICNKGFNQVSNLKDHMRTHNGDKPFLCSTCGKGFNQLGNLRQHTIRHSGVKAHLCSTCGNGFASKGELCAHLRKHTGARPFVCSVCNHGFTTSSSLTKHKRIHSGEKPYECEVCKMKFSRSGILARHKRTHTGEKPYVCKFCTKAFSQSNDLSSHLRIHTGEKPFICDTCGQAFRQSSALKTHKKTHRVTPVFEIERGNYVLPIVRNSLINTVP